MSAHFLYKFDFLRQQCYFPVLFTASAALSAFVEYGFKGILVKTVSSHEQSLLQRPMMAQWMINENIICPFTMKNADLVAVTFPKQAVKGRQYG